MALPPGPVLNSSVPQTAPAVDGCLPGTAKHDVGERAGAANTARTVPTAALGANTRELSATIANADNLKRKGLLKTLSVET